MPERDVPHGTERSERARFEEDPHATWLLIQTGIDGALRANRDIDETTARLIAHLVAPGPFSHLDAFAQGGHREPKTTHAELRAEFIPDYHSPETPSEIRELLDWFGSYLIAHESGGPQRASRRPGAPLLRNLLWRTTVEVNKEEIAVSVRGDCPPDLMRMLSEAVSSFLARSGPAGRAFLSLTDVDATSPDLEDSFDDSYRGSFASQDAALEGLAESEAIDERITQLASAYPAGKHVHLDRNALWDELQDVFDIVWDGTEYHAFDP